MSSAKIRYYVSLALYSIICVLFSVLQLSGLITLNIGTASAVAAVPFTVYAGMYFGEYSGALSGLLFGAVTDASTSVFMYNTWVLTALGFLCGLLITRFFNRNFAAAAVLNVLSSTVYFFFKWITVYAFSDPSCGFVLTHFTLPSFVYTAAVGVILFFAVNPPLKKLTLRTTKQ